MEVKGILGEWYRKLILDSLREIVDLVGSKKTNDIVTPICDILKSKYNLDRGAAESFALYISFGIINDGLIINESSGYFGFSDQLCKLGSNSKETRIIDGKRIDELTEKLYAGLGHLDSKHPLYCYFNVRN